MTATGLASTGPLWAQLIDEDSEALPLWKAALVALAVELVVPLLVFGVDWSFLHWLEEPPPTPVMSVRLEQPPAEAQPRPPQPEFKPEEMRPPPKKIRKRKPAIPIELPKPLPGEVPSRIALPTARARAGASTSQAREAAGADPRAAAAALGVPGREAGARK